MPPPHRPHRSALEQLPARTSTRTVNTAEHQARLARRLTPRDLWIVHMLAEHRVFTVDQLADCTFPSPHAARRRLRTLYHWSVLDRFQPATTCGAAPMHYVLGPAGATVLAAHHGLEPHAVAYRRARTVAIAHSQRLTHTLGINTWFTHLSTQPGPGPYLQQWWGEDRCRRHWGDLVRPDGYGRWTAGPTGSDLEFFLEYDRGTESNPRVARKLHDYAALAAETGITTPVLIWLPTHARETSTRRLLADTCHTLPRPELVPVATATAEPLAETAPQQPAGPCWLPLGRQADTRHGNPRHSLATLRQAWPHLSPPAPPSTVDEHKQERGLPAPCPQPPAPTQASS